MRVFGVENLKNTPLKNFKQGARAPSAPALDPPLYSTLYKSFIEEWIYNSSFD